MGLGGGAELERCCRNTGGVASHPFTSTMRCYRGAGGRQRGRNWAVKMGQKGVLKIA